ncbi:hypothetical protein IWX90DRAFT_482472 [Phyllosticta citrichinensis]|uniref:RING-type domain-containing protein n=1 Tax=Phyllosticta citrichinensis TaxID=1130410 RepID=A0ABR1Y791_9PEZI
MASSDSPLGRLLQVDLPPGMELLKPCCIPRMTDVLEVAPELTPTDPAEVTHIKQLLTHLSREQSLALADKVFDSLRPELEQLLDSLDFEERDCSVFRLQNGPAAVVKCVLLLSLYQVSKVLWVGLMAAVSLEAADEAEIITVPEDIEVEPFEEVPAPSDPRFYCVLCTEPFVQEVAVPQVGSAVQDPDSAPPVIDILEPTDSPSPPSSPSVHEVVSPSQNEDGSSKPAEVVLQDAESVSPGVGPSTDDSADSPEPPSLAANVPKVAQTYCDHLFCIECLTFWIEVSANCPDCRELL